jgi:hypothetical protein
VGKNYFQESLDLSLTNFPEKKEMLGRSKYLRRSSSGGYHFPRSANEIQEIDSRGRKKVEAFESFENLLSLKESVSSGGEIWTIRSASRQRGESTEEKISHLFDLNARENTSVIRLESKENISSFD